MATGTGKTAVSGFIADWFLKQKLGRILVVCHRDELIRQAARRFFEITGQTVEIEKADEAATEDAMYGKAPIVVASVQSLLAKRGDKKRMHRFNPAEFGLVWVDEAHHMAEGVTWTEVLEYFCSNPNCKALGGLPRPTGLMRNLWAR